jgi:hypothetical protein
MQGENVMARNTAITTTMSLIPALLIAAFTGAGFLGVTSLMGQIASTEYDCKVTKFEKVEASSNELLIHTDGCSNTANREGNVFRADVTKLEKNFTEEKFYAGVQAGKTYDFTVQGMNVEALHMIPTVTKVTENFMPY